MIKNEEKKQSISNIKTRLFRGYHQIIKNEKTKKKLEKLKKTNNILYILANQESLKEYLPFEKDYETFYKKKYKPKLDDIQNDDLKIIKLTKNEYLKPSSMSKTKSKKNKIFFTQSNSFNSNKKAQSKSKNLIIDTFSKYESENKNTVLEKLFPNKEEIYQYSYVPFFSLNKNPYNNNALINLKENDDVFSQEDFLYRLSHKKENIKKYINNNFNRNKGVKRGKTIALSEENKNLEKKNKNLKLELDIDNITGVKNKYISSKERRYKIMEKEIEPLKNIISLFKDFETQIEKEDINDDINKTHSNNKDNNMDIIEEKPGKIDIVLNNNNNFDNKYMNKTFYNNLYQFKKPRKYPTSYYISNQLYYKYKRFEDQHKLGYEEFSRKINLKSDKDINVKKYYKKKYIMDEYEKEYFRKLFRKNKISLKEGFLRTCRINDIILVSKLKCEFSPRDAKRILNGIKPWDDCKKLDEKFIEKNIPNKITKIKTINFE